MEKEGEVKFERVNEKIEVGATAYLWAKRMFRVESHVVLCRRVGTQRVDLQKCQIDSP
jgi:hypothetical protein